MNFFSLEERMISHQPAKSLFLNDKEYWMSKNRLLKNSVIWASFEGSSSRLLFERLVRSKRPYNITSLWRLFLQRTNMRLKNGLIASNSLYGPRKMEKSRRHSLNPKQVTKMNIGLFHGSWFQNKKPLVTPPSPLPRSCTLLLHNQTILSFADFTYGNCSREQ